MGESNPWIAGNYFTGQWIGEQFTPSFGDLLLDERISLLAEFEPRPYVDVLIMLHTTGLFGDPDNLGAQYGFFHLDSGGNLQANFSFPVVFGMTHHYIGSSPPPTVLVMSDENDALRYITCNPNTLQLTASATFPAGRNTRIGQFFGPFIEFVADDGQSIYRLSVDSGNNININLDRIEPERNAALFVSHGHPDPYNDTSDNLWLEGLVELSDIDTRMEQTETGYGGLAIPLVSTLSIQLSDGSFDYLVNQAWDTRRVIVRAGLTSQPIQEYRIILRAQTERAEWNLDRLRISLRDKSILFDRSAQVNTYAGTGGNEGSDEIKGALKKKGYGFIRQASPTLIDANLNLYQVNDGPIHAFGAVAQGGVPLTFQRNGFNLPGWIVSEADVNAGMFRTDISRGMLRLAAPPGGPLTVDFFGSTDTPREPSSADIIRAITLNRLPEVSIDVPAFNEHKQFHGGLAHYYIEHNISVGQIFRELANGNGDFVTLTPANNLKIEHINRRDARAFIMPESIHDNDTFLRRPPPKPGAKYRFAWRRSWTQLREDELLGAANINLRQLLVAQYRWSEFTPTGPSITSIDRYQSAKTVEIVSLSEQDSLTVGMEIALRDHIMKDIYEVTVTGFSFLFELGDTVLFQADRWGLHVPRTMIIIGISEQSPTGRNEDQTRLILWG